MFVIYLVQQLETKLFWCFHGQRVPIEDLLFGYSIGQAV